MGIIHLGRKMHVDIVLSVVVGLIKLKSLIRLWDKWVFGGEVIYFPIYGGMRFFQIISELSKAI